MPFGLTYATYATAIVLTLVNADPSPDMTKRDAPRGAFVYSYGMNDVTKHGIGRNGLHNFEYWAENRPWLDMKPIYSIVLDGQKGGFFSYTLRKDFYWKDVQITPYAGLALYQSDWSNYRPRELLQYRTGIDFKLALTKAAWVTVGYYHLSNFGIQGSAGVDATRVGFTLRF